MTAARVTYILVNWNTEATLPAALRSIQQQTLPASEVILINNASPGWDAVLVQPFPELEVIHLPRNVGFAEGNNIGIRRATGHFVVLLNCDAELAPDFTELALGALASHPEAGTLAPKLLLGTSAAPSGRIDSAGHIMRHDRTAVSRGHGELDQGLYDSPAWVFGATAAAVVYRRTMLDSIAECGQHFFDPDFFSYYEDVDLDWRAQLAGWKTLFWPSCVAYHRGHGSGGRRNWRVRLRAEKNRYLMLLKNDTVAAQLRHLGALAAYELWHLTQLLVSPVQLLGLLLGPLYFPKSLAKRLSRPQPRIEAEGVAANFLPRGPIPPLAQVESSMRTQPGLVTVVLVNYNGCDLTAAALAGLGGQDYRPIEVIVVDNASSNHEAERLAAAFPHVRVLRMERNLGFAAAVNWGIHCAHGEWVTLLNNDAVPTRRCISNLVECQLRTNAWAVSGRLIDLRSPDLVELALKHIESAKQEAHPDWTLPAELRQALQESALNHGLSWYGYAVHDAYATRRECFYPSGGLCCLPRSSIGALGPELLRHGYFAYYEDVELGFRIRAAGGWVAKEPSAVGVHLASSTARKLGSFRLAYLRERNRLTTLRMWLPGAVYPRLGPLMILQCFVAFFLRVFTQPLSALGFAAAHLWCIGHWLSLMELHHQLQRQYPHVGWPSWAGQLSGQIRGSGGPVNRLALWWARVCRIPVLEDTIRLLPDAVGPAAAQAASTAGTGGTRGQPSPTATAR